MTTTQVFEIYDVHESELRQRLDALNKKARKLGVDEAILTDGVADGAEKSDHLEAQYPNVPLAELPLERFIERKIDGETHTFRAHLVTITAEPVVLWTKDTDFNDVRWQLVAVLQHEAGGNIVRRFPDTEDIALGDEWRTAEPHCDHCGTRRNRKDTFLLWSEHEGLVQLGRNCLRDYTGHVSASALADAASWLSLFRDLPYGYDPDAFDRAPSESRYLHVPTLLAWTALSIRRYGWTLRTAAREDYENKFATADDAVNLMLMKPGRRQPGDHLEERDRAEGEAALAWVRDTVTHKDTWSDYEWNLLVACKQDYISHREVGLVCSAVAGYQREQERDQKAAIEREQRGESHHVGEIGERLPVTFTCLSVRPVESYYGVSLLCKFVDADGNVFTWFASAFEPEPGHVYEGKATVKGHNEYNGVLETQITRAKLSEVEIA